MKRVFLIVFLCCSLVFYSCSSPCSGINQFKLNIININSYAEGFLHFVSYMYCENTGPDIKMTYVDNNGVKKNICTFTPQYNTWISGLNLKKSDEGSLIKSLNLEYPNNDGGSFVVQRQEVAFMITEEWELQLDFYSLKCSYANLLILPSSKKIDLNNCRAEVDALLQPRYWRDNGQLITVECSSCI